MGITVVPFESEHLDAAAGLLAARHRRERASAPALPARYEDSAEILPILAACAGQDDIAGFAAIEAGRLAGYLLGQPDLRDPTSALSRFSHPRAAAIPNPGYALASSQNGPVRRALYAAMADHWLDRGLFTHYVSVSAADANEADGWSDLGFGRTMALGVRPTGLGAIAAPPPGIEFRQATPDDAAAVERLGVSLFTSMAGAPIFIPDSPESRPAVHGMMQELIANPANAHWLATQGGEVVALQTFLPPGSSDWFLQPLESFERCIYLFLASTASGARSTGVGAALLAATMEWARAEGYTWCALHYLTASRANPFWQSHGFRPVRYRLARQIDERIPWSRPAPD
jgi:GNAT superfamily N-acetyltransferase